MNQSEFIARASVLSGETKKTVEAVLRATADVVTSELKGVDGEIKLPGIGKLHIHAKAARTGWNPKTGEEITISARLAVGFTAAKSLKEAVNR